MVYIKSVLFLSVVYLFVDMWSFLGIFCFYKDILFYVMRVFFNVYKVSLYKLDNIFFLICIIILKVVNIY